MGGGGRDRSRGPLSLSSVDFGAPLIVRLGPEGSSLRRATQRGGTRAARERPGPAIVGVNLCLVRHLFSRLFTRPRQYPARLGLPHEIGARCRRGGARARARGADDGERIRGPRKRSRFVFAFSSRYDVVVEMVFGGADPGLATGTPRG